MERIHFGVLVKQNPSILALLCAVWLAGCSGPRDKADEALSVGDGERAAKFYSLALDRDPTDSVLRRGLGEANLLLARHRSEDGLDKPSDWSGAVRELERAGLSDSAGRAMLEDARYGWARSLLHAGDSDRAVGRLEAIVESRPEATRARNLLAIVVERRGDPDRATELFLQNTAIDSNDADAFFNLAMVEWNNGRKLEAIDHLLAASRLSPEDPEILWWLERMAREGTTR